MSAFETVLSVLGIAIAGMLARLLYYAIKLVKKIVDGENSADHKS